MSPVCTPAVLLRAYAYGETSRIVRFYTRDHGLVSVMARGVRTRSGQGSAPLDTFASGDLIAYVRPQRDLHTMKEFICTRTRSGLGADVLRFAGASVVGELVVTHTEQQPHPEVFEALEGSLDVLEAAVGGCVAAACLSGAWRVVDALGFAPELDACVRCGRSLADDQVGRFDLAGYKRVLSLAAGQDAYFNVFRAGATPGQITFFAQSLAGPVEQQRPLLVATMRQVVA